MQLRVETADLKDAIAWAKEALAQTPREQGKLKFEAKGNELKVTAVGRDRSASCSVEARVEEAGIASTGAELAVKGIHALPSEFCSIETEGNAIKILAGGFKLQLAEAQGEDASLPSLPKTQGIISPAELVTAVKKSAFAVAKSTRETDAVFSRVKMEFKKSEIVFVGCDRYQLARCVTSWKPFGECRASVLAEASDLKSIANLFKSLPDGEDVRIGFDPENPAVMSFEGAGKMQAVQLLDASDFPNIEQLFKDEYDVNVIFDKDEFTSVFRRVAAVTEGGGAVHLDISPAKCVISNVEDRQEGEKFNARAEETINATLIGRAVELDFSPKLSEALSFLPASHSCIRMRTNENLNLVEFDGQATRDSQPDLSYRYMVTPIRV